MKNTKNTMFGIKENYYRMEREYHHQIGINSHIISRERRKKETFGSFGYNLSYNFRLSQFRGSAWEWVDNMEAYYLHQFVEEQPDLNYRNQNVVDEMKEILRFWLRKGVSGFRIDAVPFLYETKENDKGYYNDEPLSGNCKDDPLSQCYLNHTETKDLDETYEMIYQWRHVVDEDEFKNYSKLVFKIHTCNIILII